MFNRRARITILYYIMYGVYLCSTVRIFSNYILDEGGKKNNSKRFILVVSDDTYILYIYCTYIRFYDIIQYKSDP